LGRSSKVGSKREFTLQEDVLKTVLKNYAFLKDLNELLLKIVGDSKAHGENELVARLLSDLRARKNAVV